MEMVLSPDYVAWRKDSSAFEELAAMQFHGGNPATIGGREPFEARYTRVSHNFVTTLGLKPARGRNFEPNDELPNSPRTTLLTDSLWRDHFQARPSLVGESIVLDGVPYQVIGILPRSFVMPLEVPTDLLTTLPVTPTLSHHDRGPRHLDCHRPTSSRHHGGASPGEPQDHVRRQQSRRAGDLPG